MLFSEAGWQVSVIGNGAEAAGAINGIVAFLRKHFIQRELNGLRRLDCVAKNECLEILFSILDENVFQCSQLISIYRIYELVFDVLQWPD